MGYCLCSYLRWEVGLSPSSEWFSTFLLLPPFNIVPPVAVTPNHKIISLLLHNYNLAVVNCNLKISYAEFLICDPHERVIRHPSRRVMTNKLTSSKETVGKFFSLLPWEIMKIKVWEYFPPLHMTASSIAYKCQTQRPSSNMSVTLQFPAPVRLLALSEFLVWCTVIDSLCSCL